ncbi:DUF2029 domain-containing protein [Rhodothermus sp. AH-315-K08]|nr:DUF2029 domain-containing protein [Rhodothermus sp. AH-315-K08]
MNRPGQVAALVAVQITLTSVMVWGAFEQARWSWMVLAGFASALLTFWIFKKGAPRSAVILAVAIVMRLLWLALPPTLSDDSFRYAWDGMLVVDGQNPYEYVPSDSALATYQDHPVYEQMNSRGFYSVYPPASQVVFAAADWMTGSSHPASFFVYKSILVFLEVLALIVLCRIVPTGVFMLFAWSPVVVLAGAGQAHSDVLLALPIVLVVFLSRKSQWGGTGIALAVAALVKIWPLLVAPFVLKHRRAVVLGSLAGIVLAGPFLAGYVWPNVRESLDLYVRYFEFNAGLYYGIKRALFMATGEDWSKQIGPALRQAYLLVLLIIWIVAWRRKWPLESLLFAIAAWYLIASTTVHPWYFYPVLLLAALRGREAMAWHWVSIVSLGTYLLYSGGPYWPFVWVGWTGFLVLATYEYWPRLVEVLLRDRSTWKADWIAEHLDAHEGKILDVGGAEGFVAERLGELLKAPTAVAEVRDVGTGPVNRLPHVASREERNRVRELIPFHRYDGRSLPFDADSFGSSAAVFTLHHATDAGCVLEEMARITSGPIVIIESVYRKKAGRMLLRKLDILANRIRTLGRKGMDEEALHFRTANEWRSLIVQSGLAVTHEDTRYNLLHKKHLFRLVKASPIR